MEFLKLNWTSKVFRIT